MSEKKSRQKPISDLFFGDTFHRHRRDRTAKSQTLWLPINGSSYFSAHEIVWIVADESGVLKWQTNGRAKGVLSDAGGLPLYQRHTLLQHNKLERYSTCDEYFRPLRLVFFLYFYKRNFMLEKTLLTRCHHSAGPQGVLNTQALVDGRVTVLLGTEVVH